ncbi:c-type cytochrome [Methylobacterium radiotolerans]|uniref:Cytochrome c class I n=1 Tax=Methylobacterium radiotolerans (strain ATCC 27329 / DSM 1819 / JCM 2831 / NBRC 15690 / NCIMB 10815 / 0-1) TaxID=426355 RepID=B1LTA5_METRJ|nr:MULTISPECIES: cytochrome c [Methylobacterium]ACB22411.1 cytochrome c class I [Methylobacterium radiotolerans JCM 2831]KTS03076.1 cytochrome C [Methylobacterium radiotolerans]KTS49841.1 cytochrome C [Methylobacterium radiotolerans]MDE3744382.1 cytochrome c [Methylobacterium radiotolerans]PVZ07076.1 cbb3-type cytochrome c oxidase subunit III [Methylobacterium organophilum]
MPSRRLLLGASIALRLLAGPAAAEEASAARGRALAGIVCARCHAVRMTGASPMREAPPFRSLAERFPIGDLADVLDEGVERRHPAMPDFRLDPSDAADLTVYMRTLRR